MADISATDAGRKIRSRKGKIDAVVADAVDGDAPAEDDGSEALGMSQSDFAKPKKRGLVDSVAEPEDDGFKRVSRFVRVRVKKGS